MPGRQGDDALEVAHLSLLVARFEAERQGLAIMDQPNTAKVFDAAPRSPPIAEHRERPPSAGGLSQGWITTCKAVHTLTQV